MKIIYQDKDLLVIDKPTGWTIKKIEEKLPDNGLLRKGIVHRLDKETSGVLLIAKNDESLQFFQKQFKNRRVEKSYLALVVGNIKENSGTIKTLISRNKKGIKQRAYLMQGPEKEKSGARIAETQWNIVKKYKEYTLVQAWPKTGRKHQIRVHFSYLNHPIAGDKLYSFKNQKTPEGLKRQFLHAESLKIKMPGGETKTFYSELPKDLKQILCQIK